MARRPDRFKSTYSDLANSLNKLGESYYRSQFGQITSTFLKCLGHLFETIRTGRFPMVQSVWQVYFTGFEAIKLVMVIAAVFGTMIMAIVLFTMPMVGFGDSIGNILVVIIVRELGPILTAFLVAGRTGAGLATYIGNMKVESEIDALESMGIDPIRFLAMPALLGCSVSMVVLSMIFSTTALTIGYGVSAALTEFLNSTIALDPSVYLNAIFSSLSWVDLVLLVVKPTFFGILISMIASQRGLSLHNDVREVPQAASDTVVNSFVAVVISDMLFLGFYINTYTSAVKDTGFV